MMSYDEFKILYLLSVIKLDWVTHMYIHTHTHTHIHTYTHIHTHTHTYIHTHRFIQGVTISSTRFIISSTHTTRSSAISIPEIGGFLININCKIIFIKRAFYSIGHLITAHGDRVSCLIGHLIPTRGIFRLRLTLTTGIIFTTTTASVLDIIKRIVLGYNNSLYLLFLILFLAPQNSPEKKKIFLMGKMSFRASSL